MPDRDARAKLRIYQTIYRLNLSFANIVANCRALGESGNFEPEVHPALPVVCTGTAGRNQRGSDGHHGRGRIARHAPVRQGEDCEGKGTPRPERCFYPCRGAAQGTGKTRQETTPFEKEQNTSLSTGYCPQVKTVLIALHCSTLAQMMAQPYKLLGVTLRESAYWFSVLFAFPRWAVLSNPLSCSRELSGLVRG